MCGSGIQVPVISILDAAVRSIAGEILQEHQRQVWCESTKYNNMQNDIHSLHSFRELFEFTDFSTFFLMQGCEVGFRAGVVHSVYSFTPPGNCSLTHDREVE